MPATRLDPLAETLERLERQLEIPYVSGELHSWSQEIVALLGEIEGRLRSAIGEHPQHFKTIVKNYPNLNTQVEKMRTEDENLEASLQAVTSHAVAFARGVKETVLAEQQIQPKREKLVAEGLAFIIQVRKQQAALDTWLNESLRRDNGSGD